MGAINYKNLYVIEFTTFEKPFWDVQVSMTFQQPAETLVALAPLRLKCSFATNPGTAAPGPSATAVVSSTARWAAQATPCGA